MVFNLNGFTTYRVYAECETESTIIRSVWGNSENPMVISSTGHFYNHLSGGVTVNSITPALLNSYPSLAYDSWVTIDLSQSAGPMFPIFSLTGQGNLQSFINAFHTANGQDFIGNSATGEVWSGNQIPPNAGSDLRILLGQFTTNGDLGIHLNIQYSLELNCEGVCETITVGAGNSSIGCSDPIACNYDSFYDPANVQVCTFPGCTDPTACNFDMTAGCDDGSCLNILGCMDPFACNYDPSANCEWNCIWPSCHDPLACNYNPLLCEGGDCNYSSEIKLFRDLNMNGVRDINDPWLNGLGLSLLAGSDVIYMNGSSSVYSGLQGDFPVDMTILGFDPAYQLTTPGSFQQDVCDIEHVGFNLVESSGLIVTKAISTLRCTLNNTGEIFISNQNSGPVNVSVILIHEPELELFSVNNGGEANSQSITWSFSNVESYADFTLNFAFLPPDVSLIGDQFEYEIVIEATDLSGNVLNTYTYNETKTYFCGYDPNNKVSDVVGYRDESFVLAEERIPFTINFQNTGNAPALNVQIIDSLDIDVFDLTTIEWLGCSHDMYAVINPDGVMKFIFENINLPDSSSHDELSRGYVMYSIQPFSELPAFTQLVNDAYIYFDDNPPIHTNSTLHTIFDCALLEQEFSNVLICEGEEFFLDATYDYTEGYEWFIDGEIFSTVAELNFQPEIGTHMIELNSSNPLCDQSTTFELLVMPLLTVEIEIDWQSLSVNATGGETYDWYTMEGELIPDEHGESIAFADIPSIGVYCIGTDEYGCQNISSTEIISQVEDLPIFNIAIWPNPVQELLQFTLPAGNWSVKCFDAVGKMMFAEMNLAGNNKVSMKEYPTGFYSLIFMNENGKLLKGTVIRE